ncbi:class III extradiol dioxygenase subunit B-like domain-containing protein [Streptomyces sp. HNM0645]|uniref:class III extradiol dioxygenase subunit B-like domain-containing protein n=1 Tax=Streptomyces sp. HNM0645 TaxID=2782343 RepID=UPI0024B8523E|nr:class III extradiol dioxygenase subunit B-like domain-containing protein [Streptomyces sp. HNM0645]MDI9887867.1 class III extradiol dioxygenase subunit B-like domain-containing protein [Streptomyces sp. HNM0645]
MLVAAAVCPSPPLLVPDVAAGAAPELDAARHACADVLGVLAASRPEVLFVVGAASPGERPGIHAPGTPGSFEGFGVASHVRLGVPDGPAPEGRLPVALAVGAWLLERANWSLAPVEGLAVDTGLAAARCVETGRELAARARRVALLVMGDGSARRTLKAPGYLDERAAPFDAEAARALGAADTAALAGLDESLARELQVAGRAPWQVLAGAAEDAGLTGQLLYEDAPYGVGYFVAAWS